MKTVWRCSFSLLLLAACPNVVSGQTPTPTHSADLALSGTIDMMDLFVVSNNWRAVTATSNGDLSGDGVVGPEDLLALLREWHTTLPILTIPLPNLPEGAVPIRLVRIPAGTFDMGSPENERGRDPDEAPVHTVTFADDFYIGESEVTRAQWLAVMGALPTTVSGVGDNHPVNHLSWDDCQTFISALNAQGPGTFRLPTEAEWEYACRGPESNPNRYAPFSFGDDPSVSDLRACQPSELFDQYMWWCGNAGTTFQPVRGKLPNPFGLYDMHGNLWEWCEDWYHDDYEEAPTDGSAQMTQYPGYFYRVLRGGQWFVRPASCRSAVRLWSFQDSPYSFFGFRLVMSP